MTADEYETRIMKPDTAKPPPPGPYNPNPRELFWLAVGCAHVAGVGSVLWGARNEAHQFWATHTSDLDGHTDYYWADEITESRLYTSSGELFVHMTELGYSGPCTILKWDLSLVKESEVIV